MAIKSQQELYDDFIIELQSQEPALTDSSEGSMVDVLAGVVSVSVSEILALAVEEFRKTFFSTANGPEVTGGPDELETLAVDHFGEGFARPQAAFATGSVLFTRATDTKGDVTIPAGTIVKTDLSAAGTSSRFQTLSEVVMTGLSISASVRAIEAGPSGNVVSGKITQIETSLTDASVVVTNSDALGGGEAEESDSQYRETIRSLLQTLAGATLSAIEAKAKTVGGVERATAVEFLQYVKEWDVAENEPVGEYFGIPRVKLYIADVNGGASSDLLAEVKDAVRSVRAAGVRVEVLAATALALDWTVSLTLNMSGPSYASLHADPQAILDDMQTYLQNLPIGTNFNRASAEAEILGIWGPSGTNDLVSISTSVPSGDVAVEPDEKIVPGTMGTV